MGHAIYTPLQVQNEIQKLPCADQDREHCIHTHTYTHTVTCVQPTFSGYIKSTFMKDIMLYLDVPQVTELPVMDIGLFSGYYVSGL